MVVVYQPAVATDGDVLARLLEVAVTSLSHVDDGRSLTAADALLLAGDADGATADTDLDEVRTSVRQVAEALLIDHVPRTDQYLVAIGVLDPAQRVILPLRVAVRGIDAQHVGTCLDEGRDALTEVAGVDPGTDQQLLGMLIG